MLLSSPIVICLLSFFYTLDSTYAIPVSTRNASDFSAQAPFTMQRRAPGHHEETPSASAIKAALFIKAYVTASHEKFCFYSGSSMVGGKKVSVFEAAPEFKPLLGCKIMKDILDTKEEFAEASKTWADADWAITSKALADSVHGENFVVLGTTFSPTSFWVRVERPALQLNSKVPHGGIHAYQFVNHGDFRADQALFDSNGEGSATAVSSPKAGSPRGGVTAVKKNGSTHSSSRSPSPKSPKGRRV